MRDFEITKREVLLSIAIVCIMITLGFFISSSISSSVEEKNEVYHKALKIEDMDMYEHAKNIGVGNAFSIFTLDAVTPQSIPELTDQYLYIERVYEIETLKTRVVTETYTVNGKTQTRTRTETYWDWDVESRDRYKSPTVIFNGTEYPVDKFHNYPERQMTISEDTFTSDALDCYRWNSTYRYTSSHHRYSYYIVPLSFEGSTYLNLSNGDIEGNPNLHKDTEVQDLYTSYLANPTVRVVIFWIIWMLLTAGLVFGFYYIDNRWLEDHNHRSHHRRW